MSSETHYIIIKTFYNQKQTDVKIIIGEEKFRKYAFDHYYATQCGEKEERICTHHDINQFLNHHDATYFDEKDRSIFKEIVEKAACSSTIGTEKYKDDSNQDMINEEYHPPKIDDFKVYWIHRYSESMYRHTNSWVQDWVNLKTMKTDELVKKMVNCSQKMIRNEKWGWSDIVLIEGDDIKSKSIFRNMMG